MSAHIIDGRRIAAELRDEVGRDVAQLQKTIGRAPGLAVVLVGDDPASKVYVNVKSRAAAEVGLHWENITLPTATSQDELIEHVHRLGEDPAIDGILVQLPLPDHIDEQSVLAAVNPAKDVDGFHPVNAGRLFTGGRGFQPCTPAGIIHMIRQVGIDLVGKEAVVIGRSIIVGKPVAALLLQEDATVTMCHSRTKDLAAVCRRADLLVAAVGQPRLITKEFVRPGAAVIDVGVNRLPTGELVGDVDFDDVRQVAGYVTPVPGGVGPLTIAMLMKNTLLAAQGAYA